MNNPTFFFVAHVQVGYNTATAQYDRFKKITAGAVHTDIIRYQEKKYLTFIAHFDKPMNFKAFEGQLRFYYGGKSKVLKVDYSTTNQATYYYSAYLLPNLTSKQKHYGFYSQKIALLRAAAALITVKPVFTINNYECSVLIELSDRDIRQEDILNLKNAMVPIPHQIFMTSRLG